ncbi:MAG: DUF4382 domain-containing protein [Spirulina sp.]
MKNLRTATWVGGAIAALGLMNAIAAPARAGQLLTLSKFAPMSILKSTLSTLICSAFFAGFVSSCTTQPSSQEKATEDSAKGTLNLVANGEDFVRQGFVTKDGWEIEFARVYVTLADVTAYQTELPYESALGKEIEAIAEVTLLTEPKTVDLAEGDENADPILVSSAKAPEGTYNALTWQVVKAEDGEAAGSAIALQGTAKKDGKMINFNLNFAKELAYICGEFIGDKSKGSLKKESFAELETTFHFDHIFGDSGESPDDDINTWAVGFDPLAALAREGTVTVTLESLRTELDEETYRKLEEAIIGLGHVGEGHCQSK